MNIEINVIELQQLLHNLYISQHNIDQAAKYYIEYGLDKHTQHQLCSEWYNQFYFSRGNVDGEKSIIVLLQMAQRVLDTPNKAHPIFQSFKETFKEHIIRGLNHVRESQFSSELTKQVKEMLRQWEERQVFTKQESQQFMEIVDPVKLTKDKLKNAYPPPIYLINIAKNHKELLARLAKQKEIQGKLDEILANPSSDKGQLYDQLLESYQKSCDSVQKYRQLVIKDTIDELKELDKLHYKSVVDLKYIAQRVDELRLKKDERQSDYFVV